MTKTNTIQYKATSRSTSKALYEAGLDIKTEFYWKKYFVNGKEIIEPQRDVPEDYPERYPAYLTDELLAVMPMYTQIIVEKNKYFAGLVGWDDEELGFSEENAAEALGQLLLWLIENEHLDVTNLNKK